MARQYWLMKCEPSAYTISDLERDRTTCWEGVRNFQARNFMRDQMQVGDLVLFYASNADPSGDSIPSSVANMYYVIAVMIYARVKLSEESAAITKAHSRP